MYKVYDEFAYNTATEIIRQETNLLNQASQGCITFAPGALQGDFGYETFWASVADLIKVRNAYGTGDVAAKDMAMLENIKVKVGMGTYPINLPPSQMEWIQRNPEEAGAAFGIQVAKQSMISMINTGVQALLGATVNAGATVNYDGTGDTPDTMTNEMLVKGAAKFGDASSEIKLWVMHSTSSTALLLNNMANAQHLFTYENVNIVRDVSGRLILISDIPSLFTIGSPNVGYALGLTPGAIQWTDNADYFSNIQLTNGKENILRTMQSEWSWNLALKGYKWDTAAGGHSPDLATLVTGTNWDKVVTSHKDLAAVAVKTN